MVQEKDPQSRKTAHVSLLQHMLSPLSSQAVPQTQAYPCMLHLLLCITDQPQVPFFQSKRIWQPLQLAQLGGECVACYPVKKKAPVTGAAILHLFLILILDNLAT